MMPARPMNTTHARVRYMHCSCGWKATALFQSDHGAALRTPFIAMTWALKGTLAALQV